jgi:ribose transport system substrate-binding protein
MSRMWIRMCAAALVVLAIAGCGQGSSTPGTMTIAVIPKGTAHIFWQSIHAGAQRAAKELGVEVIWRGPVREDDRDSQVSEVEGFVSRGVSGIVLAPLDETALMGPVAEAKARNIPVVIIDSGLKGTDFVSFVATDNQKGGELGGDRLADAMGGTGKAVLLRYAEGSDSTNRREAGFLASMKKHSGIEVVSDNQFLGSDVEGAYKRAEAVLSRFKNPDGSLQVNGIFCPNESTTFATMRVLQDNGWAGKVKLVGFDAAPNLVDGLDKGIIDGLVLQDPVKMGYLGVKTMVSHLRKEPVEARIDTGVTIATPQNRRQPEIVALLEPERVK